MLSERAVPAGNGEGVETSLSALRMPLADELFRLLQRLKPSPRQAGSLRSAEALRHPQSNFVYRKKTKRRLLFLFSLACGPRGQSVQQEGR